MPVKKKTTEDGGTEAQESQQFAVYQFETGSYQFGEVKVVPNAVTAFPDSIELPEDDDSPVKVFDTAEAAQANLAKLQKQWDAKKGKLAKES